jgi:hypothetical protein
MMISVDAEDVMSIPTPTEEQTTPEAPANPLLALREHLQRAAALAAELNIDLDAFMKAAWQAYMEARPGLREHLEDLQLVAQIDALRKAGRLGSA